MEYTINDKITQWIVKNFDEDYIYEDNHFRVMMLADGTLGFFYWNLNIEQPNLQNVQNIDMSDYIKRFPKNSMEDLIQRITELEKISKV
jgi:hypothetical protein